ncbi:MAG: DEAD/DEAH box helicase family protein [Chloroflexi bacterium]|nr:DEAD/DEAH box helicase family protein [Chloroflexota bacterium]
MPRRRTRRRRASTGQEGVQTPMQPVEKPILCSPYKEPSEYWLYDQTTGEASRAPGRRPAGYWFRDERVTNAQQGRLLAEENWEELPYVNGLREDVRRWRNSGYRNATNITRPLLRHWQREDKIRRLFFCQIEAVETIIYLAEVRMGGKRTAFNPRFSNADLANLVDAPPDANLPELTRLGCKMATGSGKTVVMAMLIAWAFCNRGQLPSDERFPSATLVVCPNLTIKERLQVLRPDNPTNYYAEFDLVPTQMRRFLQNGKVLITNWHQFAPESQHAEGGKTYAVVNKGEESADAFSRRVLGDLYERGPVMVLNDEGHHAYRPRLLETTGLTADERREANEQNEEATVWIQGLDRINASMGVKFCVDLSATPFYIKGSGNAEGQPFPWLVSDFSLVDAIESGIVKIPRLPVDDTTGRPEPRYFRLWKTIMDELTPGERLPGRGRKPKPEVIWEKAQSALITLASQYKERFEYIEEGSPGQDKTPPAMIIVCDNTDIAELFHHNISGESVVETDDSASGSSERSKRKSKKKVTVYSDGQPFPELFSNSECSLRTLRIDSKMLAKAESGQTGNTKGAEELRKIVDSVGKSGEPGEQVRCVVSVQMLTEGWDANNVTHILGLRAFESQLLCEQVVGRGLRRMDYTPDPETGMLTEEYVDVYGIPFSVIPYKGRPQGRPEPGDKPKHHVHAMPERKHLEIRFPVVEGYTFDLKRNLVKADVAAMESLRIEPNLDPTSTFIKPQVGYDVGVPTLFGPGDFEVQDRKAFYESSHIQQIKFQITRRVVDGLTGYAGNGTPTKADYARHKLFPQVYSMVDEYARSKIDFLNVNPCELGLERYMKIVSERLMDAIKPNDEEGEPPLLPILNRYAPIATTADVDFKTVQRVHDTAKSHLNQVVLDTATWESAAAFRLEESDLVGSYAKNDHLGLTIAYEYQGVNHYYEPDFLVRLSNGLTLIVETKGYQSNQDSAKHEAARKWVSAVNNWGQMDMWDFHVCYNPHTLGQDLREFA